MRVVVRQINILCLHLVGGVLDLLWVHSNRLLDEVV